MTIVLFVIILLVLVVGHEFGHLIVAKLSGMDVPEFGIGFPPKLWGKKIGATEYTINALPFGGFVKIVGEDASADTDDNPRAFSNRPKYAQALTLLAGPFANILIAFLLSSLAFMVGVPAATDAGYSGGHTTSARTLVVEVASGSPAEYAGMQPGDEIIAITESGIAHPISSPEQISALISGAQWPLTLSLVRNGNPVSLSLSPKKGIVPGEPERAAIGIATVAVGTLTLPFFEALRAGFMETVHNFWNTLTGILSLIGHAFTFSANVANLAGPVGIARLVGSAQSFGLGAVLSFAALISINLGVINLFPFPALDGGRFAFLAVETVSGKRVPSKFANAANTIGFALLLILMLAVTAHDIIR